MLYQILEIWNPNKPSKRIIKQPTQNSFLNYENYLQHTLGNVESTLLVRYPNSILNEKSLQ